MPGTWSTFSKRFSAMSNHFEDFVANTEESVRRTVPYSLILLDESNNEQLPRLVEFMQEHGTPIDPILLRMVAILRGKIEENRLQNHVPFCTKMLLLGRCNTINACPMRHTLIAADRSRSMIPRSGHIKFDLQHCHSPAHYSVHIVEHLPLGGKKWLPSKLSENFLQFSLAFASHYSDPNNVRVHDPVKVGDVCVVADEDSVTMNSVYHRCIVTGLK